MDTNKKVTPDGPIVGDVAAVIKDVLYGQIPIVVNLAVSVENDDVANTIVDAMAELVNALTEKAVSGGYAIRRNYEAWSREDLKERSMPFMPYG
jgi:hypothetical protein